MSAVSVKVDCGSLSLRLLVLFWCTVGASMAAASTLPSPLICEDSVDGKTPFNADDVPCIIGCVQPVYHATLGLLPGAYNETGIAFCQAQCVMPDISPGQIDQALSCRTTCQDQQATPEQYGWCLNLCLRGEKSVVLSTTCIPWHEYGPPITTVIGGMTETVSCASKFLCRAPQHREKLTVCGSLVLSVPSAWVSWSKTQTIITGSGIPVEIQASSVPLTTTTASSTMASVQVTTYRSGPSSDTHQNQGPGEIGTTNPQSRAGVYPSSTQRVTSTSPHESASSGKDDTESSSYPISPTKSVTFGLTLAACLFVVIT